MTDLDKDVEVVAAPHLVGTERYINRELSWLDFNARVLALAEDAGRPLLERVKFCAIFSQNLDEFFQVRVAGLMAQRSAGVDRASPDAMTPKQQLEAIRTRTEDLTKRLGRLFGDQIGPALSKEGISIVGWDALEEGDRAELEQFFEKRLYPVLTPLAVDPAHPFPYISNLSLNLAVVVGDPAGGATSFARVKIPPSLPRFVPLPDGERFLPLEDLIAAHLEALFPGMDVLTNHPFRVTRNADMEVEEDEAEDLLQAIEVSLRQRKRSPHAVRLEMVPGMPQEVRELLIDELDLDSSDVYVMEGPLDLGGLWSIYALDRPDLKDPAWTPTTQPALARVARAERYDDESYSIFDLLRTTDVLVHHPYDAFASSVVTFIEQAANDPHVLAIKWTLYRTSGPTSPIIRNLIRAAETGKQVVALVELKARFDEEANIAWARALEEAGVHVVYGVVGLKTHAKTALVVRQEGNEIRRYTHIGTGNYNPSTATLYEDVGVLSADADIGSDISDLFNFLTGYSRQRAFRKLLVAPLMLRRQLLDLIAAEASMPDGKIAIKVNNLVDPQVIDALYAASQRGAQIDLIVRGACCLRPGVVGLSENIRVRSILGRFLEHARILRFGSDARDAKYFIGSADAMARNLNGRVEVVAPVTSPALKERLAEILETNLADDTLSWELEADGTWHPVRGDGHVDTHERLQLLATRRARGDTSPAE